MIALQSLKYKIFEWCLDTLTDKLIKNFQTNINKNGLININLDELREGMILSEIHFIIKSFGNHEGYWKKCKIEEINYWDSKRTKLREILFTWSSYTDNKNRLVEFPPLPGESSGEEGGLSYIQSYDQDKNGLNRFGIIPEFYI